MPSCKYLIENYEQYFWSRSLGIAGISSPTLAILRITILCHFWKVGLAHDVERIDGIISAELPTAEQDKELLNLVKKCKIHRLSQHCHGLTRTRHCNFRYDTNEITPHTYIDEICNRAVYGRLKRASQGGSIRSWYFQTVSVPYQCEQTARWRSCAVLDENLVKTAHNYRRADDSASGKGTKKQESGLW